MNINYLDFKTLEWINKNPDSEVKIVRCKKCAVLFSPDVGHVCKTAEDDDKVYSGLLNDE